MGTRLRGVPVTVTRVGSDGIEIGRGYGVLVLSLMDLAEFCILALLDRQCERSGTAASSGHSPSCGPQVGSDSVVVLIWDPNSVSDGSGREIFGLRLMNTTSVSISQLGITRWISGGYGVVRRNGSESWLRLGLGET